MTLSDLQPHLVVRSLLDEVVVRCEHSCGWTGRRDARPAHAAVCPVVLLKAAEAKLRERDSLCANVDRLLADRDAKIRELEAALKRKDEEIVRMGKELLRRQVCISKLEHPNVTGLSASHVMEFSAKGDDFITSDLQHVSQVISSKQLPRDQAHPGASEQLNLQPEGSADLWL
eukprot:CAMPEP_0178421192 /NCGR_PEP_ID=MMETSP0689_2-20121128/26522_1 /TAXON_ID=160604 /ORGANISM="Amphidinium massartii, Strain CS-259" /LENGTH=172 /DNA_ID=CAMNT_0020042699 /DNA_START=189 /DNA_END=707 /DNA_ORIENTATION=+